MLLNIVQYPDGSLPPESATLLKDLAAWFGVNGEAIYGTRPWRVFGEGPTEVAGGHFKESSRSAHGHPLHEAKGGTLYAIALGWPANGKVTIRSLASPTAIKFVTLLGCTEKLAWTQTGKGLAITLPKRKVSDIAITFEIKL